MSNVQTFLIAITGIGAALGSIFWLLTLIKVRPILRDAAQLHLQTVYVGTLAWILLDLLLLLSIAGLVDAYWLGLAFSFDMGLQVVAAISAFLFALQAAKAQ
jgi:hypothetical protein